MFMVDYSVIRLFKVTFVNFYFVDTTDFNFLPLDITNEFFCLIYIYCCRYFCSVTV